MMVVVVLQIQNKEKTGCSQVHYSVVELVNIQKTGQEKNEFNFILVKRKLLLS